MKNWFWPGVTTTALLTVLAAWFGSGVVEKDLASRTSAVLAGAYPWASVDLDGRDLTLKGVAPDERAQAEAASLAAAVPGVRSVDNAAVLPPVADPFVFQAIKADDGVTLTGNVPPGPARSDLLAVAERAMPGIRVTDNMTIARGAAPGFPALAGFAVSQLADLSLGEVSISDLDYTIKGSAAGPDAYEVLVTAIAGVLPGEGKLVSARIVPPAPAPGADDGQPGEETPE
ncbi:BON domain-containing protein [Phyllobacterium phragmitis]|uniref:BON domain-containing protein n=1 Tax=Phyllobacterium phragmitis TaxID=2670329 RepID=A0ABQ0GXT0_9HYPH